MLRQLSIISTVVVIEFMMPNDLTQVERVDGEEDGPMERTLRSTLVDRGRGEGTGAKCGDKLSCCQDVTDSR